MQQEHGFISRVTMVIDHDFHATSLNSDGCHERRGYRCQKPELGRC
jgi:hypothetical protein